MAVVTMRHRYLITGPPMSPRPDARVAGWAGALSPGRVHRCIREGGGRKKAWWTVWSSGGWLRNCKSR